MERPRHLEPRVRQDLAEKMVLVAGPARWARPLWPGASWPRQGRGSASTGTTGPTGPRSGPRAGPEEKPWSCSTSCTSGSRGRAGSRVSTTSTGIGCASSSPGARGSTSTGGAATRSRGATTTTASIPSRWPRRRDRAPARARRGDSGVHARQSRSPRGPAALRRLPGALPLRLARHAAALAEGVLRGLLSRGCPRPGGGPRPGLDAAGGGPAARARVGPRSRSTPCGRTWR